MWKFLEEVKCLFAPGEDIADVILQAREPNYLDDYIPRNSGTCYDCELPREMKVIKETSESWFLNSGRYGIYRYPISSQHEVVEPIKYRVCKYCGQLNHLDHLHCEYCGGRLV